MEFIELTEATWPKLATLFAANKNVGGCWCTWFMRPRGEVDAGWGDGNREFLRARVAAGAPLGVLAVEDDEPLGWVAVAPRPTYRLNSAITTTDGGPETWSVTCFFVHRTARRRGLAAALLDAAVEFAAANGAQAVEAFPVDTEGTRRGSDDLFHGTLAMFQSADFTLVERRGTRRALVRKDLR